MAKNEPSRRGRDTFIRALISYRLAHGELRPEGALKPLWRAVVRRCLAGTTLEK
ncbi:MAG: hypothetical protein WAW96_20980 [Alphaproteobacteria bacterium]